MAQLALVLAKGPRSDARRCSQLTRCSQSLGHEIWWSDYNPCQGRNAQSQPESEAHKTIALVQWAAAPALHGTCVDGKRTNAHCACSDLVFIPPYNRVNFHDKLLVYDHTTGETPVLVRSPKLSPVGRG